MSENSCCDHPYVNVPIYDYVDDKTFDDDDVALLDITEDYHKRGASASKVCV